MILFCKHIARTVKRAPWQPLLILLTLVLSTTVAVTAFRFYDIFSNNADQNKESYTAAGDVLITPSKNSDLRLLFTEDAKRIVRNRGQVLGEYALTFFMEGENGKKLISASALDLVSADRFYDFSYLKYGSFTTENLNRSAVISDKMAKEFSLSVKDTLTVTLFDSELTYTVEAIAQSDGLLCGRDMLVQTDGIVRHLSKYIPIIGSLGDAFHPYNRIMIRTEDPEGVVELLHDAGTYAQYHVEAPYPDSQTDFYVLVETVTVSLLAILVLTLAFMLIANSMSLLHMQRKTEYALFAAAGACPSQLSGLLLSESVLYALIGGILGTLLATPMLRGAGGLFAWNHENVSVGPMGWLFGILSSLLLMTLCTLYQIKAQNKISPLVALQDHLIPASQNKKTAISVPLCLTVLFSVSIPFFPASLRYLPASLLAISLVILLYTLTPFLLRLAAKGMEKHLDRSDTPKATWMIALKSIANHFSIRHVCRLFAVLLAMVLTLFVCHRSVNGQLSIIDHSIKGEIAALNVPDDVVTELKEDGLIKGAMTIGHVSGAKLENDYSAIAVILSGDTEICTDPAFLPRSYPKAGQVALSAGIAKLLDAKDGDTIHLTVQGQTLPFTVSEILPIKAGVIYLDENSITTANRITNFKLRDSTSEKELINDLESRGVAVIDKDEIWKSVPLTLGGFLDLSLYTLIISILLALAGCANLLLGQYRTRKREWELLRITGADRKTIIGIYLTELTVILVFAAVVALVFGALICCAVNVAVGSFGYILF